MAATQTYENHTRFVPLFHFVVLPILLVNILMVAYEVVRFPAFPTVWGLLVAIALFLAALFGRVFALAAQNRLIRLEERLRMREVLPAELQGRIGEFTAEQLIALRFASDGELAELSTVVLRDNVQKRDAIKKLVKQWRADDLRV
jgi:putative copper export protein